MNNTTQMLADNAAFSPKKTIKERLLGAWSEYGYLLLGALIPAVLFFLIYLVRGLYPLVRARYWCLTLTDSTYTSLRVCVKRCLRAVVFSTPGQEPWAASSLVCTHTTWQAPSHISSASSPRTERRNSCLSSL